MAMGNSESCTGQTSEDTVKEIQPSTADSFAPASVYSFSSPASTPSSSIPGRPLQPSIYGDKKGPRIENGLWLAAGIPQQYLINGIPIAGVINEHGIPRPSLRGSGVWPCEETIEEITRMLESDDLPALREAKSLVHLGGRRTFQLRDAYVWIALRQYDDGSFVISESARNKFAPRWRELLNPENDAPAPTVFDLRKPRLRMAQWREDERGMEQIVKQLNALSADVARLAHQIESVKHILKLTNLDTEQSSRASHVQAELGQMELS
ncbi:Uncharacterized protein PECH_004379 [Penicillium ucsense]|uniref:Uncharacterized protein n=1 Tax=Penicillium ucsense TaxID=2839758 RepID=A0A8J8WKB2_9EURO|nr:Uncharacterized protein PECM_005333 [Penicillium ucsense]KAF7737067.1 Uncharacterized protein PECH_004379 [Penicillium ucsense]